MHADWRCNVGMAMWLIPIGCLVIGGTCVGLYLAARSVVLGIGAAFGNRRARNVVASWWDRDGREDAVFSVVMVAFLAALGGYIALSVYLQDGCSAPLVTDNAGTHRIIVRRGGEPATCDERPGDVVIDPGGFAELRIDGQASVIACDP